jgi:2-polyprenyl-3-methyl-5-hydroxy-6-metoxy-1,4-benzoquinol methylase
VIRAPYDKIAEEFARLRTTLFPLEKQYLELLLKSVPAGGSILDLGCGTGTPIATHLNSLGYKITGVDASARMLDLAKKSMPNQKWIHSTIEEVDLHEKFAAVICWDSIFHLPREMHSTIFQKINQNLLVGGRLMVSSGGDVGKEGFTDKMFGEEFYYDSLPQTELFEVLNGLGFKIISSELFDLPDGARNKGKRGTIAEKSYVE